MRPHRLVVVPCSGAKLDHAAPAAELYRGPLTRDALRTAVALVHAGEVDGVLILSALHGLVGVQRELAPYDVTVGDPAAVTAPQLAAQLVCSCADHDTPCQPVELLPLLPKRYAQLLADAAELVDGVQLLANPLAGSRGLLEQRSRLTTLRRAAELVTSA